MDEEHSQLPPLPGVQEQKGLPPVKLVEPPSEKQYRTPHENEDASDLPEFTDTKTAGTLSISEVKELLEKQEQDRKGGDTKIRQQTLEYTQTFARFASVEALIQVREVLSRDETLTQYEIAQIANLCPGGAEEAKALIPSLAQKDDDLLESMMAEIKGLVKLS